MKLSTKIAPKLLIALILCSFSSCENVGEETPEQTQQPNVVLIFMDDMGYGDLECYGNPLIKTPHLNQLAEGGIRFTSFYAPAAVCTPSRAGLLTGKHPVRTAPYNFGPESKNGLPLSEVTIANVLKEVGYRTAAIGKWHLGHRPEYLPTSRGFDSFYGLPYSNDMILPWCPWLSEKDKLMLYQDTSTILEVGTNQEDITIDYMQQAISFIKADKEKPFFLYLAHSMPHLPISAAKQFQGSSAAGLYGDVIEMVDWTVGEIIKTLKEEGIEDNTLVIFTSDNGPWHNLPDRMVQNGVQRWHTGSSGIFRGAKTTTYEGGFRVPGIMYWPDQIAPNQVNREIVSALDVFPTVIEMAGAELPNDPTIDGLSLLPMLKGEGPSPRTSLIYSKEKNLQAIRKKDWKLRFTKQDGMELYNLKEDPSEMYNRAEEFPEMAQDLLEELQAFTAETQADIYQEKN